MKTTIWFASIYGSEEEMRKHQFSEVAIDSVITRTNMIKINSLNLKDGYNTFISSEEYNQLLSIHKKELYIYYFDDKNNIVAY